MVANIQNFPGSLDSFDEVASAEQAALPQQQLVPNDSEIFCWRKVESLRFVVQVGFSVLIVGFCIGKLSGLDTTLDNNKVDSDKAIYWGGITSIVAWWMPTPGARGAGPSQK